MPVSSIDVISPAFKRMKKQLFQPFRFSQWLRFALVGFLAGEMGPSGGFNGPINFPSRRNEFFQVGGPFGGRGMLFIAAVAMLLLVGFVLAVVFIYISSRMRFVLFDSVVAGECRIRRFWRVRGEEGFRLFVWHLLFFICFFVAMALVVGLPVLAAFALGVFRDPGQHVAAIVLGVVVFGFLFVATLVSFLTVHVFTKDFVVPQMAYESITVGQGWSRLWEMMKTEKGSYAGYIGMKILLTIAAVIVVGIATLITILILLIPVGAVALLGYFALRGVALAWNPITIALAAIGGLILVVCFLLIAGLVSAPAIVFFPAYSIHFFADRYAPLRNALFPPADPALEPPV